MTIGKAVRELLAEKGLSQRDLAEATGMDQGQVSRIVNDAQSELSLSTLDRLENALGLTPGAILIRSGRVQIPTDVRAGIEMDPKLNEDERWLVLTVYDRSVTASRKAKR